MKALLESEPGFSVVGEAGDGLEAVRLLERLQPDVMVLDLMMPGLGGIEVLRIVGRRPIHTRIVVLSMHSNNAFIAESLKNGATGYVLKGSTEKDLVRAVREAAVGRRYLSPPVSDIAIDAYIEQARAAPFDPHETLSAREREVLQLAAEGRTSPEIAERLHLSPRTVENHRANINRKLGLQNQSDLVRHALRHGLIALDA